MSTNRTPDSIDIHVGHRIRARRHAKNMTQEELAGRVGIRFQQIQKYETGANRVSASRLWNIAETLDISVTWFFANLGIPPEDELSAASAAEADVLVNFRQLDPDHQIMIARLVADLRPT